MKRQHHQVSHPCTLHHKVSKHGKELQRGKEKHWGYHNDNADKVLKLRKALYGLRQAPRAWNAKLDLTLQSLGFERWKLNHALYKRGDEADYLLVGVYVDDLIITGTTAREIACFKA